MANVLELIATLKANVAEWVKPLTEAAKSVDDLAKESKQAADAVGEMAEEVASAANEGFKLLDDAATEAVKEVKSLDQLMLDDLNSESKKAGEQMSDLDKAVKEAKKDAGLLNESPLDRLKAQIEKTDAEIAKMKESIRLAEKEAEALGDQAPEELIDGIARSKQELKQMEEASAKAKEEAKQLGGVSLAKLRDQVVDIAKRAREMAGEFGRAVEDIGKRVAVGAAAMAIAITAPLAVAANGAADFDKAFAEVVTLLDQPTPELIGDLKRGAEEISMAFGVDVVDSTKAMYQAISAGIPAADAFRFLQDAAIGAKGGVATLTQAVDLGTNVINAYGLKASDLNSVLDSVFIAVKKGKTTFEEMQAAIGRVAPVASQTGVSLDELNGAIAAMTLSGINTNEAVTGMRSALSNILKPSKDAIAAADALGLEFNATAIKTNGLSGFLADLNSKISTINENRPLKIVDQGELKNKEKALSKVREEIYKVGREMNAPAFSGSSRLEERLSELRKKRPTKETREEIAKIEREMNRQSLAKKSKIEERLTELRKKEEEIKKGILDIQGGDKVIRSQQEVLAVLFGSIEAANAIMALGANNGKAYGEIMGAMAEKGGAASGAFKAIVDNDPTFVFAQIAQQAEALSRVLGESVLRLIAPLADQIRGITSDMLDWAYAHPEVVNGLTLAAMALAALLIVVSAGAAVIALLGAALAALAAVGLPIIAALGVVFLPFFALLAATSALILANWDAIRAWVETNWPKIKETVVQAIGPIVEAATNAASMLRQHLVAAFGELVGAAGNTFPPISVLIIGVANWISEVLIPAVAAAIQWFIDFGVAMIRAVIDNWPKIQEAFKSFIALIGQVWETIKSILAAIESLIIAIANIYSGGKQITTLADAFGVVLEQFKKWADRAEIVLRFLESIIGAIKKIIDYSGGLQNVLKLAGGLLPGGTGASLVLDAVMGTGGVVTRPTVALIGESGPEAVIPLDDGRVPVAFSGPAASARGFSTQASAAGGNITQTNHISIYQQKGESAEELARKVSRYILRQQGAF